MTEYVYAIGDIHGRFDCYLGAVKYLKSEIEKENDVEVVFLGDYIDRGPDSMSVVFHLRNTLNLGVPTTMLQGNHEVMMYREHDIWYMNGGKQTIESYDSDFAEIDKDAAWMKELPLYHRVGDNLFFVHAGVDPDFLLDKQTPHDMQWIRGPFLNTKEDHDFGARVVFGHTPMKEPLVHKNKVGLDLGAFMTGRLAIGKFDATSGDLVHIEIIECPKDEKWYR